MKRKKAYRRFIKYGGKLIASPEFQKKSVADDWYFEMRKKKSFIQGGLEIPGDFEATPRLIDYSRTFMDRREKVYKYPKATTYSDEQRLRHYVLPFLSEVPIGRITAVQIKTLLKKISEPGFRIKDQSISPQTRDRVKALLSAIFTEAINEDPPLVKFNPVAGIKFSERRLGKKKPRHLGSAEDCLKFLTAAKEIGQLHYVVASLFLMTGARKQELIAWRWSCFDSKSNSLEFREKYEQASNSILPGTKAGEDETRKIFIPKVLATVLNEHKKKSKFKEPDDFILVRADGRYFGSRHISRMIEETREKAGLDISAHGLRHTFGREFAEKTGNLKALQAILGHATSTTTDIYSDLAGDRIRGFGESVAFEIGAKRSASRHTKTQK